MNKPSSNLSPHIGFLFLAITFILAACNGSAAQQPQLTMSVAPVAQTPRPSPSPLPERIATPNEEQALALSDLGWIAFTASEGGRRDVWLIRPDGTGEINLTGELTNTFAEAPVWSPDGEIIAFDGLPGPDVLRDVYLVTVSEDPVQSRLTALPGFDCYPSFSPDGEHIVYMSERNKNRDLFIMDIEGNDVLQLTSEAAYDYEPNWSPDGEKIVFVSRRDGNSEIYVMDANGGHVVRLTEDAKLDWRPVWSPDGEWIAFESWRNGRGDIFIMHPDGTDLRQLTTSPAEDGNPTFSPDGRFIVFHSQRTGNYQLFILEVDDPENLWHLETGSVRSLLPAWSPVTEIAGAGG